MIILKRYWLSILLVIIIIVLCFINPPKLAAPPMTNFDKLAHFLMFLGLSGTLFFDSSLYFKKKVGGWLFFGVPFLFPIIFSGGIEIAQDCLTVSRSGDWMDFLFDVIGVFCGCLICLGINRRLKIS